MSVVTTSPERIISPPMVGVPFLVMRWPWGPSSRIGWPWPWRTRSAAMMVGPKRKTNTIAVIAAPAARKVM